MTTPDEVRSRLVDCFEAVFPDLDENAARTATTESVDSWDSLASISLVAVIEEEFDVELPEEDIRSMTTFDLAANVLDRLLGTNV